MAKTDGATFDSTMPGFYGMNMGFTLKVELESFEEFAMIPFEGS
jgi:hypothetical protein